MQMYVKLHVFIVIYASDTTLYSETVEGMKDWDFYFCWKILWEVVTETIFASKTKDNFKETFSLFGENIELLTLMKSHEKLYL